YAVEPSATSAARPVLHAASASPRIGESLALTLRHHTATVTGHAGADAVGPRHRTAPARYSDAPTTPSRDSGARRPGWYAPARDGRRRVRGTGRCSTPCRSSGRTQRPPCP